jgi:hypothetical protein
VEDDTRITWDQLNSLIIIVNCCHSWCPRGMRVSYCEVYTFARLTIDLNLLDTLGYGVMACLPSPNIVILLL